MKNIFRNEGGSEKSSVSRFVRHFVEEEQEKRLGKVVVDGGNGLWADENFLPVGAYISVCMNMRPKALRMGTASFSAINMYSVDMSIKQKTTGQRLLKIDETTSEDDLVQLLLPEHADCELCDSVHIMITMPDDSRTYKGKSLDDSSLSLPDLRDRTHEIRCIKAGKAAAIEAAAQLKTGIYLCKQFDKTRSKKQKVTDALERIDSLSPSLNAKSRSKPEEQMLMARLDSKKREKYLKSVAVFASRRFVRGPVSKLSLQGEALP